MSYRQVCEGEAAVGYGLSGDARGGTIDVAFGAIDDVNNSADLAVVRAVVDDGDAADLYEACVTLLTHQSNER